MRLRSRIRYPLAIALVIAMVAYILWQIIVGISHAHSAHQAALIALGGLGLVSGLLVIGFFGLLQVRRIQRYEVARYAATTLLHGRPLNDQAPFQHQPPASQIPLVIRLRPNWWRILGTTGFVILLCEWLAGSLILLMGDSLYDALSLPVAAMAVLVPAFVFLAVNEARQTIEVSRHKLVVVGSVRRAEQPLRFAEAQLFAIVPPGKRGTPPICYELAGTSGMVRWLRIRRHIPFMPWMLVTNTRPTMPQDEYEALMEWLLGYIAEQTGLSLIDLR